MSEESEFISDGIAIWLLAAVYKLLVVIFDYVLVEADDVLLDGTPIGGYSSFGHGLLLRLLSHNAIANR